MALGAACRLGGIEGGKYEGRNISQEATALALLRHNEHSDKNRRDEEVRMDFQAVWEAQITRLGYQPAME